MQLSTRISLYVASAVFIASSTFAQPATDETSPPTTNESDSSTKEAPTEEAATEEVSNDEVPTEEPATETETVHETPATIDDQANAETLVSNPESEDAEDPDSQTPSISAVSEPATPVAAAVPPIEYETPPVENTGPKFLLFLLGPGLSFGFFYPEAVNNYLEEWASNQGAQIEDGTTSMFMNFVPRFSMYFAPIEYIQIQAVAEIGWAPKLFAVVGGESNSFHYTRYSVGGTVNGHIPIKNKYSLFLGGGVLYHWLNFDDYEAGTPGYRAQIGFRIYKRIFTPEVFIAFDYINAETGQPDNSSGNNEPTYNENTGLFETFSGTDEMILNYTGVMIGANFLFNITHN